MAAHLHTVLQRMVSSLPIWVLEHTVSRLGLVAVEEDSGVVLQLVAYLATCLAHLAPVSAITSRILILLMVGARLGLDHRHIGGRQDGVTAEVHGAAEAAALAQGLPLVIKHVNTVLSDHLRSLAIDIICWIDL